VKKIFVTNVFLDVIFLYTFDFFIDFWPHDKLYILALRPTNWRGGVEPVSDFIFARTL